MNIHVPQSVEEEAELRTLSASKKLIMNGQNATNNLNIVQDTLLSVYLLTKNNDKISREDFYQYCMVCKDWSTEYILKKIEHIDNILNERNDRKNNKKNKESMNKNRKNLKKNIKPKKLSPYNGRGLFSMLLPDDFNYELEDGENKVKIYRGVLLYGYITKKMISSGKNTIIQIIHKEYNEDICLEFINNTQFLMNYWMTDVGFSIGIEDCIPYKSEEIEHTVSKSLFKAERMGKTIYNPDIREVKTNMSLNEARDSGLKIAKNSLKKDNNFISTVESGSKGDYFNIAQITGLLGQQNIEGKRIPYSCNHGYRAMPYYDWDLEEEINTEKEIENDKEVNTESENTEMNITSIYESRGFISNPFISGLNLQEFWFHAMCGRSNVGDTALKTQDTGYLQRKMGKILDDVQVKYDGTVRDTKGNIYQYVYSDDGFNRECMAWNEGKLEPINIQRLCDRLNMK